jgi:hypothetical protein
MPRLGLGPRGPIPMESGSEHGGRQSQHRHRSDDFAGADAEWHLPRDGLAWTFDSRRYEKPKLCKHMKLPTSLKTPPHGSAIWYSNCCVIEVNQNGIQAGRTSEKRDFLSSSENHPKNQKGAKVAHGG